MDRRDVGTTAFDHMLALRGQQQGYSGNLRDASEKIHLRGQQDKRQMGRKITH